MAQLGSIIDDLYRHLFSFPEVKQLLTVREVDALKTKQTAHWARLFQCQFDDAFVTYAVKIGQVHFERKVPPYVYLAAYNHVQCQIASRLAQVASGRDLAAALSSLSRVITLDIDLALSAYTRAFWSRSPADERESVFI
jgi:hypothetical protein